MNKRLYVGNLNYDVTNETLAEYFAQAGKVENAEVISYEASGRSKGFGFVEMATEEDAQAAIEKFDGVEHQGRVLKVEPAQPREDQKEESESTVESASEVSEEEASEEETAAEAEEAEAEVEAEPEKTEEDETESEETSEEADAGLR